MLRWWSLLLVPLVLLTSGCWDRIEVEERAYVLGLAMDLPENEGKRKISIAIPVVQESGAEGSGNGGGSVPLTILSSTASTVLDGLVPLQNKLNKELFFGHQKVLVFSEACAAKPIIPWVDFFERVANIPRSIMVAVCQGEAAKALETSLPSEQLPPLYLHQLLKDIAQTGSAPYRTFNDLMVFAHEKRPGFMLPLIKVNKDNIEVIGSAVLKENSLAGTLTSRETRGALWLTGEVQGGVIDLPGVDGQNRLSFRIGDSRRLIRPRYTEKGITFEVKLIVEGSVEEYFGKRNVINAETTAQAEAELARQIRKEIAGTVAKLQKEFGTDALGLGEFVRKRNPKLYRQIGDWNHYFANQVEVKLTDLSVQIRRTGVLR